MPLLLPVLLWFKPLLPTSNSKIRRLKSTMAWCKEHEVKPAYDLVYIKDEDMGGQYLAASKVFYYSLARGLGWSSYLVGHHQNSDQRWAI